MRTAPLVTLCMMGLVTAASAVHGQPRQDPRRADALFSALISRRNAAMARADTGAVHHMVADDMHWVIGASGSVLGTTQFLEAVSRRQSPQPRFDIDSLHARMLGRVASVTYRRLDHRTVGAYEQVNSSRCLELLVRRGTTWVLLEHTQTWIVRPATIIALDSVALAAFIGRYEIGPGVVDDVHWENKELVATLSGQTLGGRLLPVSGNAFSPDGMAPLIVFERDASGRVMGYVQGSPDGGVRRARRIP